MLAKLCLKTLAVLKLTLDKQGLGLCLLLKTQWRQLNKAILFKTNIGGLISGEGSAELLYNPSETGAGYTTFIDDVLTTGDNADALFELFPDSATSAKKISFAGIITSAEYGATLGEVQIINISFQTSGTITSAI